MTHTIDAAAPASGPEFARGMDMLAQAMGILSHVDISDLPGEGLGEVALTLAVHSRQLTATQAAVCDRFASSGAWADDAARTAGSWFAGRTNDTRTSGQAVLEPVAINSRGELIATLPTTRTIPSALRKAVLLRDVVCRIPGCWRHIEEIHHVRFFRHGGPTSLGNLAGLCWFHHHLIHHGNWTLVGDSNEALILTNTHTGDTWPSRPPPRRDYPSR